MRMGTFDVVSENLRNRIDIGVWSFPETGYDLWHYDFARPQGLRWPDCSALLPVYLCPMPRLAMVHPLRPIASPSSSRSPL